MAYNAQSGGNYTRAVTGNYGRLPLLQRVLHGDSRPDASGLSRKSLSYSVRNTLYSAALLLLAAACGGNGGSPTQPTNPGVVTSQVYNATTGQKKDMTFDVPSGSSQVIINAADLASGLGDVVTSEFAVRTMGTDNSLGSLVAAAGSTASLSPGSYEIFVPARATLPDGRSVYECDARFGDIRNPTLNGNKRDLIVGVQNMPGVNPVGLPMYVWTDAINDELNHHIQSDNGRRYGSIRSDPDAVNPDLTVGFANDYNPALPGSPAWWSGNHAYMLGPDSVQPLRYNAPVIRDAAIEEVFEMIFRFDNICNTGSRNVIGKAFFTNYTQWGLNAVGVNLLRRNFTRAR